MRIGLSQTKKYVKIHILGYVSRCILKYTSKAVFQAEAISYHSEIWT